MPRPTKYTTDVILEAALELTEAKGVDALTARTLAAWLNCSTGPIFSRFESMEALHEVLMESIMEDFIARVAEESVGAPDPILGAAIGWLGFAAGSPGLYEALFLRRHAAHAGWGRVRMRIATDLSHHERFADRGPRELFGLVGRVAVVMHGLGLEVWAGRLSADDPEKLVRELVMPVLDATEAHGWNDDLHSTHNPTNRRPAPHSPHTT